MPHSMSKDTTRIIELLKVRHFFFLSSITKQMFYFTLAMNDFPVIGDLYMRRGLWDRQEANIAMQVATKKCMAWSCFAVKSRSKFLKVSKFKVF